MAASYFRLGDAAVNAYWIAWNVEGRTARGSAQGGYKALPGNKRGSWAVVL
jgi:hypothetical protein